MFDPERPLEPPGHRVTCPYCGSRFWPDDGCQCEALGYGELYDFEEAMQGIEDG